jgi:hypothetical protein
VSHDPAFRSLSPAVFPVFLGIPKLDEETGENLSSIRTPMSIARLAVWFSVFDAGHGGMV